MIEIYFTNCELVAAYFDNTTSKYEVQLGLVE
jgi:hypothetical protein